MAKRQFTKGIDLYHHQLARLKAMQATMQQGVKLMKDEGLKDAEELTSGTLTKRQTRGQFARGRSPKISKATGRLRGRTKLLPINKQSGRLFRSMYAKGHARLGFEIVSRGVPYARYILHEAGTRKMVARGMKQEAQKRLRARRKAHLDHFKKKQRNF